MVSFYGVSQCYACGDYKAPHVGPICQLLSNYNVTGKHPAAINPSREGACSAQKQLENTHECLFFSHKQVPRGLGFNYIVSSSARPEAPINLFHVQPLQLLLVSANVTIQRPRVQSRHMCNFPPVLAIHRRPCLATLNRAGISDSSSVPDWRR